MAPPVGFRRHGSRAIPASQYRKRPIDLAHPHSVTADSSYFSSTLSERYSRFGSLASSRTLS